MWNLYNVAQGNDDGFIDDLAKQTRVQSVTVVRPRRSRSVIRDTPMQIAFAWLVQRSPNIRLIPGTSSIEHLQWPPPSAQSGESSERLGVDLSEPHAPRPATASKQILQMSFMPSLYIRVARVSTI